MLVLFPYTVSPFHGKLGFCHQQFVMNSERPKNRIIIQRRNKDGALEIKKKLRQKNKLEIN